MKHTQKEWVKIGYCPRPHGIKGELSAILEAGEDSVLAKNMTIGLAKKGVDEILQYTLTKCSIGPKKAILKIKEINSRNDSEEITPSTLYLLRDDFPKADDGEIYLSDIIGLKAFDPENPGKIGRIESFYESGPGNTIIVINVKNESDTEVPFVDAFIKNIDLCKGEVHLAWPEYIGDE